MRFRKKPVVIDAFQWHPALGCVGGVTRDYNHEGMQPKGQHKDLYMIHTLGGNIRVSDGDWIIKGVKGERYPCRPDIFEQTYELVLGEK